MSAGAGSALFVCHGLFAPQALDLDASAPTAPGNCVGFLEVVSEFAWHFYGGGIGGSAHAVVMTIAPQKGWYSSLPGHVATAPTYTMERARLLLPWIRHRISGLPVTVFRDGIGFGIFFGVHAVVLGALHELIHLHEFSQVTTSSICLRDSGSYARTVLTSLVAGSAAGCLYHAATYPFNSALAHAAPSISPGAVFAAARRAGGKVLYRGVLRSSIGGITTGALTFGIYDAVVRFAEEGPRRSHY